jgi:hypothetical protein
MANFASHPNGPRLVVQHTSSKASGLRDQSFNGATRGYDRARVTVPLTDAEKALDAAWRAIPMLPADMRSEVAGLLTLQSMAMIGGTVAVWAGSHFVGVGFVFDIVALGVGTFCLGSEALRAGREFALFWNVATNASDESQLNLAAEHFARAISIIGVNTVVVIFAHRVGKAGSASRAIMRWTKYIEGIQFKPPMNKGALWSKLGETEAEIELLKKLGAAGSTVSDAQLAERMAQADKRVTLEMSLPKEFWEMYRQQFPTPSAATRPITGRVWELVSERWASALEGEVVAYIDSEEVFKAKKPPILIKELETITKLVQQNKKITAVLFQDIWNRPGMRTRKIMVPDWDKMPSQD